MIDILQILAGTTIAVLAAWLGRLEMRISKLNDRVNTVPNEKHLRTYVDLKMESQNTKQQALHDDIKAVEKKLDHIIDIMMSDSR